MSIKEIDLDKEWLYLVGLACHLLSGALKVYLAGFTHKYSKLRLSCHALGQNLESLKILDSH